MARELIPNAGLVGLNKDLSQHELPINVWTDAENIRFFKGNVLSFRGHGEVYATPSVTPLHVLVVHVDGEFHWLYGSAGKIYGVRISAGAPVHVDLTRAVGGDYAGLPNTWTSTLLGGIPILNDGSQVNVPQRWDLNVANPVIDLPNWPAGLTCGAIRSFKNYLIALNVEKSGVAFPFLVKWSHPADPGGVPISWDEADATKDAGEFDLAQGHDTVVDGLALRQVFIVYKANSTWKLELIGGTFVFGQQPLFGDQGILNRNCVVEVDGQHVVLTGSDVITHDGFSSVSILDDRMRFWLFEHMNESQMHTAFVFKNPFFNEVFICFAKLESSVPDTALVWNYRAKTVSIRDLPNVHHAGSGPVVDLAATAWDNDPDVWASDLTIWGSNAFIPETNTRVLLASADTKFYMLDLAATFDGTLVQARVERVGLSFGLPGSMKFATSIWPRIKGSNGMTVLISVGSQADAWDTPVWETKTFVIGTDVKADFLVSGRYIGIKFETGTAFQWRLDSYDVEVEVSGDL